LPAAIAVRHPATPRERPPLVERPFPGIRGKTGPGRARHPPAGAWPRAGDARPVGPGGRRGRARRRHGPTPAGARQRYRPRPPEASAGVPGTAGPSRLSPGPAVVARAGCGGKADRCRDGLRGRRPNAASAGRSCGAPPRSPPGATAAGRDAPRRPDALRPDPAAPGSPDLLPPRPGRDRPGSAAGRHVRSRSRRRSAPRGSSARLRRPGGDHRQMQSWPGAAVERRQRNISRCPAPLSDSPFQGCIEAAMTTRVLLALSRAVPVPELRRRHPNAAVPMDNLPAHKPKAIKIKPGCSKLKSVSRAVEAAHLQRARSRPCACLRQHHSRRCTRLVQPVRVPVSKLM
jgi:hypothetical protein